MKKLKQINIWQWCARVIPVLYLVGSLSFYWIDEGTPYRVWAVLEDGTILTKDNIDQYDWRGFLHHYKDFVDDQV